MRSEDFGSRKFQQASVTFADAELRQLFRRGRRVRQRSSDKGSIHRRPEVVLVPRRLTVQSRERMFHD